MRRPYGMAYANGVRQIVDGRLRSGLGLCQLFACRPVWPMPSTPIAGFITKIEAAENYHRSHRQLSRDLSDAMKVQDSKVLANCRLGTEDGNVIEGVGVTPEIIDQLCADGKNPTWYLRAAWLEKTYGRRGAPRRRDRARSDVTTSDTEEGTSTLSRSELVPVLRERIQSLERDKQDMREELKIKNQQIADRVEREKETNALIRDLHTLMADLQQRLLPPPAQTAMPQITDGQVTSRAEATNPTRSTSKPTAKDVEVNPPSQKPKKAMRRARTAPRSTTKRRKNRSISDRKPAHKKPAAPKHESSTKKAAAQTKSRSFLSRLFSR